MLGIQVWIRIYIFQSISLSYPFQNLIPYPYLNPILLTYPYLNPISLSYPYLNPILLHCLFPRPSKTLINLPSPYLPLLIPLPGKTLLAKAVANQTSATFLRVVGSELIQKYLVRPNKPKFYSNSTLIIVLQSSILSFLQ